MKKISEQLKIGLQPFTFILIGVLYLSFSCQENKKEEVKKDAPLATTKKDGLYTPLGKPKMGEWLSIHKEKGQTFEQYVASDPIIPDKKRNKIYILPVGNFDADEQKVLVATVAYLKLFFEVDVIVKDKFITQHIPDSSKRMNDGQEQIHTKYVLYNILQARLPQDALIFEALTNVDLYPKKSWNFVFGQAALKKRVAVSSMARFKEFDANNKLLLNKWIWRFIKTVSHETTHALSIPHCKEYRCLMNGSNSLSESDSRPLISCDECTKKILWATKVDAKIRYQKLLAFYEKYEFTEEIDFCRRILKTL